VEIATRRGLGLPLVHNTGGFDSPEALARLDGTVDIQMPDMKHRTDGAAQRYSRIRGYLPALDPVRRFGLWRLDGRERLTA
jgi:uncharacterized Fe-S radical SAM superfamily protein PflX